MPARLRPTAPIAGDAILVGDPGRALLLAQELLQEPKMSNHARGLWGYTGVTPGGRELTIQATGMGGPSASVVLGDLAELGVRRAIRIGTGTGLSEIGLGELLVVTGASAGGADLTAPAPDLTERLEQELPEARAGTAISLDTLHEPGRDAAPSAADVADMQTAALLASGTRLGTAVAAVLVVSRRGDVELGDEALATAAKRAGAAAAAVLST